MRAKTGVVGRSVAHSASLPPCLRIDSNRYLDHSYTARAWLSREIWTFCAVIRPYGFDLPMRAVSEGFPIDRDCDSLDDVRHVVTRRCDREGRVSVGYAGMVMAGESRCMKTPGQWRAWLQEHYATDQELWLVFYKKHTRKASLAYEDAIQEALCFGWIDGILKRIDDEKHMIRFSPRRKNSIWSATNKKRVAKLIAEGRMTDMGLAKVREAQENGQWDNASVQRPTPEVPAELKKALAGNKTARRHFESLAASYRKQFIWWIASAKRDETRRKRVDEAVHLLAENKKLGMK
jgi:uncharacterized protein YdeI (YjbR/CyaY-like superfamily)